MANTRFRRAVAWVLSVALLSCAGGPVRSARAAGDTSAFSDMKGHWSAAVVAQAVFDGYVNGYPDGTFRPDVMVSRAELIKMMVTAGRLPAPDWNPEASHDTRAHWAVQQGYIARAQIAGILIAEDYQFTLSPDQPATRLVATVMAVNLMGRQRGLPVAPPAELKVVDAVSVPDWARGSVKQALADGIVTGYPDGTFRGQGAVTRAEAVAIVQRTVAAMTAGIDPDLRLVVDGKAVSPPVPLAVRNGQVYVPVRGLYGTLPYTAVVPNGSGQGLGLGNAAFRGGAGAYFPFGASAVWLSADDSADGWIAKPVAGPIYRLYSEVMVPVAPVGGSGSLPWLAIRHDAATGTVHVARQDWPADSLPTSVETAALCDDAKTEMAPGQIAGLIPPAFCDAKGHTLTPRNPVFLTATVDPSGPLRVRPGSGPWLTEVKVQVPWELGTSEVGVLQDAAGLAPEGKFAVTFTGPGGHTFKKLIAVADRRPYRLALDPGTPAPAGQPQTIKLRIVDRGDRLVALTTGYEPTLVITGQDGQAVPAAPKVFSGAFNSGRWIVDSGVATFTWTPPRSGTYHLQAALSDGPQGPQIHGSVDVTIP